MLWSSFVEVGPGGTGIPYEASQIPRLQYLEYTRNSHEIPAPTAQLGKDFQDLINQCLAEVEIKLPVEEQEEIAGLSNPMIWNDKKINGRNEGRITVRLINL